MGPKRDIVGEWAKACRKYGLPLGVSVHASHAWTWYEGSQRYDGKLTKADGKGKWWEGYDPQDLYQQSHERSKGVAGARIRGLRPRRHLTDHLPAQGETQPHRPRVQNHVPGLGQDRTRQIKGWHSAGATLYRGNHVREGLAMISTGCRSCVMGMPFDGTHFSLSFISTHSTWLGTIVLRATLWLPSRRYSGMKATFTFPNWFAVTSSGVSTPSPLALPTR